METKKWIHYSWQTFLLCLVVSVSHPGFAQSASSSSTTKDNARKSKTTKPPPAHVAAPGKSISSSRQTTTQNQSPRKEQATLKKDKLTSTTTKATRQKLSEKCCVLTSASAGKTSRKEKMDSQQKKSATVLFVKEQHKKDVLAVQTASQHARQQHVVISRPHDAGRAKSRVTVSDRFKQRYVTVLKETKRQTMEKMVIAIPRARLTTPNLQKKVVEPRALPTAHTLTRQKEHVSTPSAQEARTLLTAAAVVKAAAPAAADPSQPRTTGSQSVTASPAPPPSLVPPPVPNESPLRDKSQRATPSGVASQEAPRAEVVAPPSPPPQTATVALVEPSSPTTIATKEDQREKDWSGYSPQKAPFAATVNDEPLGYRINSLFVLPGDEIFLAVVDAQKRAEYSVRGTLGPERLLASRRWYWTAPTSTGVYQLKITNTRTNNAITLNVFVMAPLDRVEEGYLNGYRIGTYPTEPLRQLAMYNRPRGLVEVTQENENTLVSPHFRLRQFLCKQDGGYPKYMILDAHLLTTLEQLLEMVNARGYQARTFSIMSGYRTPYYNRAIGNHTTYSRHLWGDAADIYIDEEPRDGKMDDLNQDGVIDAHDADVIYQLIETTSEPRIQKIMMGGLARYRETSSHGPFIHVDARGSYARWGLKTLTKGGTTRTEASFPANDRETLPSFWGAPSPSEDLR